MEARMWNYSSWVDMTDPAELLAYYEKALKDSGFGIIGNIEHHFKPQGYTVLVLLSESHFAAHTFPEQGKTYIELTSCVPGPFERFVTITNTKQTGDGI